MSLWIAMSQGKDFGWAVCSEAIRKYLGARMPVRVVTRENPAPKRVEGTVLHTLGAPMFTTEHDIWGDVNWGYTFHEFVLVEQELENAKRFDGIFAGSTWLKDQLESQGLTNVHVLVQGIDPELFNPSPGKPRKDDAFRIFSGGKLEYRKGQDVVMEAFRRLQGKYKNLELVTCWWNPWPETLETLRMSPYIDYLPMRPDQNWYGYVHGLCAINLLYPNRITHFDHVAHENMASIMKQTDVGIFMSRCEGGTNLVMMEYMACGGPVIASDFTGHLDVLTRGNSWRICKEKDLTIATDDPQTVGKWCEPDVNQVESCLEAAINSQGEEALDHIGKCAGGSMKQWTWERTAQTIIEVMGL